jgi:aconitate decarboxylase
VRELARWASALEASDLTPKAREQLVAATRDGLACAIFGSTLPWSTATRAALSQAYPDQGASVWGTRRCLPGPPAALANGLAVHAFELDDFSRRVPGVHATACVLPVVLAIAETRGGVTGADLLAAMGVGHEVAGRLGVCMGWSMAQNGWHTPAIFGAIAAAAAAGRALRLSEAQLARGVAIAALEASGLLAAKRRGMAKRLYAGHAAQVGLTATLLGAAGCEAPEDVFEGVDGFCATYAAGRSYDLAGLTRELGTNLAAEDIQLKLYAACGMTAA